jgi:hypothetical protein
MSSRRGDIGRVFHKALRVLLVLRGMLALLVKMGRPALPV